MTKKELALEAIRLLKIEYPDSGCSLEYEEPWKLLVSVRLAAQCTDARVNLVTPALFKRYKSPKKIICYFYNAFINLFVISYELSFLAVFGLINFAKPCNRFKSKPLNYILTGIISRAL